MAYQKLYPNIYVPSNAAAKHRNKSTHFVFFLLPCINFNITFLLWQEKNLKTGQPIKIRGGGNLQESLPSGGCGKLLTGGLRSISTLWTFFMFKSSK